MRFLIFVTVLFLPNVLLAGELFLETTKEMPGIGSEFVVEVFVNSEEPANVVSGEVNFDQAVFDLKKVMTGSSVISFWIEKPSERQPGVITFSGMVAGGFTASQAKLFGISLVPKIATTTTLMITNPVLLAHDGLGSDLQPGALELNITTKQVVEEYVGIFNDKEPPESFTPNVVKQENWLDGKTVLVFDTTDKDSGVDAYYIKEVAYSWLAPFSAWRLVTSPYELKDQSLQSFVYLKVEDKAGNIRQVVLEPEEVRDNYPFWLVFTLLLVTIILLKKLRLTTRN